jgi:hypothetical protein
VKLVVGLLVKSGLIVLPILLMASCVGTQLEVSSNDPHVTVGRVGVTAYPTCLGRPCYYPSVRHTYPTAIGVEFRSPLYTTTRVTHVSATYAFNGSAAGPLHVSSLTWEGDHQFATWISSVVLVPTGQLSTVKPQRIQEGEYDLTVSFTTDGITSTCQLTTTVHYARHMVIRSPIFLGWED